MIVEKDKYQTGGVKMYTLYYEKYSGRKVVVARSESLLKLLKIKSVSFVEGCPRAYITKGREMFNKFDLGADACARFSVFEIKARSHYFETYDYRWRVFEQ